MSKLKIKTHTTYTYETSDGRVFDIAEEAQKWEEYLENIKNVVMLDSKFNFTNETEEAWFVHIKTTEQLEAFQEMQAYYGICAHVPGIGYWYYDDVSDEFINVDLEIKRLSEIKQRLNAFGG